MEYNRWYDKYPDLKSLIMLLETIDDYNLELIAQDFIQILTSKYKSGFDEVIERLSHNPPPRYNRKYDANYNLHTCIEFIKTLDDQEKEELINSFAMSLISFMANTDDE